MAEKEATVFVIDVGKSMSRKKNDRNQNDLDWSLQWAWDKITNIVYLGRKTLFVGVLGLGTDGTDNHMSSEEGYSHISVLQSMTNMSMPELRQLSPLLRPSNTDDRDALSAVILAVYMIMGHCKHLQYQKKIYLITNATGQIDADDIEATAEQIKKNNIQLTVLGVDFDDREFGFKEEGKIPIKARNEKSLRKLVNLCDGNFGTMQEAVESLAIPHIKPVRPTPTYKGRLTLGDANRYDTAVTIDIERYFKVSVRRPPTASSFAIKKDASQSDNNLESVKNNRYYFIKDESVSGNEKSVEREELAKGYEYGRTAVPISESDENITKLETQAAYEIIGFIPRENIERYMILDNTNMIVAQKGNDKAALALSSLVHALEEIDSCAVARFVKKDMVEPAITLLSPLATTDVECLVENILPFAEDLRQYRFPPVDKIMTISGKQLTSHRLLPNNDLVSAMSNFVDNMTLIEEQEERFSTEETFSPVLHSIEGAIKYRAVHPGEEVPPVSSTLLASSRPPQDIRDASQSALNRVIKSADVKKVPPKVKGRKSYRETDKPLSGLDVDQLLKKDRKAQISPDNAIAEFRQAINYAESDAVVQDAAKQMTVIIESRIKNSFGDSNYERVIEELGVMRVELGIEFEFPNEYNNTIRRIKKKILSEELGGSRKELWWKIRVSKLGLVHKDESEGSDVTKQEADDFFSN